MLALDTDIFSILSAGRGPEAGRLRDRIRQSGRPDYVTVVTLQEQLRGRLARCASATTPEQYVTAARLLRETVEDYHRVRILDFDDRAADEYRKLKTAKIRVGTMDLRVAAIVLANSATLITRNLSDFRKVPRLRAEDWTRP